MNNSTCIMFSLVERFRSAEGLHFSSLHVAMMMATVVAVPLLVGYVQLAGTFDLYDMSIIHAVL